MLGKFCGSSIPLNQISGSNEVSIHFKTDGSMTGTGFKLEYSASSKLMIFLLPYYLKDRLPRTGYVLGHFCNVLL